MSNRTSNPSNTPLERKFTCIEGHAIQPADQQYVEMLWDTSYRRYHNIQRMSAERDRLLTALERIAVHAAQDRLGCARCAFITGFADKALAGAADETKDA